MDCGFYPCIQCNPWFLFWNSRGGIIGGLSPFLEAAAAEWPRMKIAHDVHLGLGRDLIFQADRPVTGVDQKPAKPLAYEILRCSHRGRKHPAGLIFTLIGLDPSDRHYGVILRAGYGRI